MKINGFNNISGVQSVRGGVATGSSSSPKPTFGASTTVSVSNEANWVSSLQSTASSVPEVRSSVVSEVRAQLQAGTFESSVDMDSLVNSLLADL